MKRLLPFLLAPCALFAAGADAPAPTPIPDRLDLRGAILYALDHNFDILQARERIREQEGLISEVRSRALPDVSLSSGYTLTDKGLTERGDRNSPYWQIALDVRQTLYSGGGVRAALDAQTLVRESALLDLQAVVNRSLFNVREAFYTVLLAREQIIVQEESVRLLEEQLVTARNRYEAGTTSNFDVLRAEVALANAKPDLIRARNGYRNAIDALRQAIGFRTDAATAGAQKVPEFIGTLDFTPVAYDLPAALAEASEKRPELQRQMKIEQAREKGVTFAKSGYLPTVSAVGSYDVRKANDSLRFRESLDGWTVGLQAQWAIFDGKATAGRVMQARSQLQQARLQTAELALGVEVEVRRAHSALREALELAEAAGRVVEQGVEALRLADVRYQAGTATQLEVLEARVQLTTARTNQLQANYSYNVALAFLRSAVGQPDVLVGGN